MKVAKQDPVIHGMLEEEQRRSREVLRALIAKTEELPKGALNVRRKQGQGKEYLYHYLVRREGQKVVNRHVAERDVNQEMIVAGMAEAYGEYLKQPYRIPFIQAEQMAKAQGKGIWSQGSHYERPSQFRRRMGRAGSNGRHEQIQPGRFQLGRTLYSLSKQ